MKFNQQLSEIKNYLQVNINISQLHYSIQPTNLSLIVFAPQFLSSIDIRRQQLNQAS